MLQGFYTAASGMLMQQHQLNVISNNLANLQTPGYKTNRLLSTTFEQTLLSRLEKGRYNTIGTGEPLRIVREVADLFSTNGVMETNRPFDMAITGPGFFNVQAANGQTYMTRNGQFDLDEEGYLILRGQGRVLGTGGALRLSTSNIKVDESGVITNSLTGAGLGQLRITVPAENAEMEQYRNGMYTVVGGGTGGAAAAPAVLQGALENSNTDMNAEMTEMMMAQRNFAAASQILQIIDGTYSKAVGIASL